MQTISSLLADGAAQTQPIDPVAAAGLIVAVVTLLATFWLPAMTLIRSDNPKDKHTGWILFACGWAVLIAALLGWYGVAKQDPWHWLVLYWELIVRVSFFGIMLAFFSFYARSGRRARTAIDAAQSAANTAVTSAQKAADLRIAEVNDKENASRAEREHALAEDRSWSEPSPLGRLIDVTFSKCSINANIGQGTLDLLISNTSGKPRIVWVSVQFELYRVDTATGTRTQVASERTATLPIVDVLDRVNAPLVVSLQSIGEDSLSVLRMVAGREPIEIQMDVHVATIIHLAETPTLVRHMFHRLGGYVAV